MDPAIAVNIFNQTVGAVSVKEENQKTCHLNREFYTVRTKTQNLELGKAHKNHATVQHAQNEHIDKLSKIIWNYPPIYIDKSFS